MATPVLVQSSTAVIPGQTPALSLYTLPSPSPGTDWTFTVLAGQIWTVLTIRALLTTSGTVAARTPNLLYAGSLHTYLVIAGPSTVAASTTAAVNCGVDIAQGTFGTALQFQLPNAQLQPGFTVAAATDSLQAADQWSSIVITALVYT